MNYFKVLFRMSLFTCKSVGTNCVTMGDRGLRCYNDPCKNVFARLVVVSDPTLCFTSHLEQGWQVWNGSKQPN